MHIDSGAESSMRSCKCAQKMRTFKYFGTSIHVVLALLWMDGFTSKRYPVHSCTLFATAVADAPRPWLELSASNHGKSRAKRR